MALITAILLGLGYYFTRSGLRGIRAAQASTQWPSTQGKIILHTAEIQKPVGTGMDSTTRRTTYRPVIQYSYSLGGKSYGGGHIIFNDDVIVYGSVEKALAAIKDYPVGKTVQVYYDPDNPALAVLKPGKSGPSWRTLSAGILCILCALIPIWIGYAAVVNQAVQ